MADESCSYEVVDLNLYRRVRIENRHDDVESLMAKADAVLESIRSLKYLINETVYELGMFMTSVDDVDELYFLNNYGRCRLGQNCECARGLRFDGKWGGLMCDQWMPLGARSVSELTSYDAVKKYVKVSDTCGND